MGSYEISYTLTYKVKSTLPLDGCLQKADFRTLSSASLCTIRETRTRTATALVAHRFQSYFFKAFQTTSMYARTALVTLAVLACFKASHGGVTPSDVVSNIKTLTRRSQALQAPAQSISIVSGPLIVIGQGPFPQVRLDVQERQYTSITVFCSRCCVSQRPPI